MSDPSILDPRVRKALDSASIRYEVLACDEHLADTAEFCAHYGIAAEDACNAILIALKVTPRRYVACLVRADTKLDVNRRLAAITGTKKMSFANAEETAELTGMKIGGVSIAGLPPGMPLYIDSKVMERERIVIGGGNRTSKARLAPAELLELAGAQVVEIAIPRESPSS